MKKNGLWNNRQLWEFIKKLNTSNSLQSIADDVVFDKSKSLNKVKILGDIMTGRNLVLHCQSV